MKDELNIPLLEDLVSSGQVDSDSDSERLSFDENSNLEIEQESSLQVETSEPESVDYQHKDELSDDASLQELLIDEEIRMILDKHMDKAYEEIIRLLNHKIN
jgi:hypothetical protein